MAHRLGVDVGGTFTDLLLVHDETGSLHRVKTPSTPADPSQGVLVGVRRICEEHLAGRYRIEVIDLVQNPQLAAGDQILAVPTLVRRLPEPVRKIIGDLSNADRVLVGLDIRPSA